VFDDMYLDMYDPIVTPEGREITEHLDEIREKRERNRKVENGKVVQKYTLTEDDRYWLTRYRQLLENN